MKLGAVQVEEWEAASSHPWGNSKDVLRAVGREWKPYCASSFGLSNRSFFHSRGGQSSKFISPFPPTLR